MTGLRNLAYSTATHTWCAVVFLAVLTLGVSAPSSRAQTRHDNGVLAQTNSFSQDTGAYYGYWAGFSRGARDLAAGGTLNQGDDVTYLRADRGYTSNMGSRAEYQWAFRNEFTRGYTDARSNNAWDALMDVPPPSREPDYVIAANGRHDGSGESSRRVAAARGYDAGYSQGTGDALRMTTYGYRDNAVYVAANDGFDSTLGDADKYQVVFRQVYSRGYSDGFNGRARYQADDVEAYGRDDERELVKPTPSRSDVLRIATVTGYHEGFERGTSDRDARKRFGYGRVAAYTQAVAGYDSAWDSERDYKVTFREGFAAGYKAAFNGRPRNEVYEDEFRRYPTRRSLNP